MKKRYAVVIPVLALMPAACRAETLRLTYGVV